MKVLRVERLKNSIVITCDEELMAQNIKENVESALCNPFSFVKRMQRAQKNNPDEF